MKVIIFLYNKHPLFLLFLHPLVYPDHVRAEVLFQGDIIFLCPGSHSAWLEMAPRHTVCFSTWVFLTAEIFSPHVPQCNVCGEMLLSSHITLTFLITPQFFCLMGKTNCLIAPNGNDMKSKFQKDAMGNSTCN